jgi:hypothetical protein
MTNAYSKPIKHRIAYFISPHGFGHAARACGVMGAMNEIDRSIQFEIFTKVPRWFFEKSVSGTFSYHSLLTDIGLHQKTSLHEDLPETLRCLDDFLPFNPCLVASLAEMIGGLGCELVICDIAPMGIVVAREAGMPSVLVENFTWDWIYQGYTNYAMQFKRHIVYLEGLFDAVDYHIQTEPVCMPRTVDLATLPVSRSVRTPASQIRRKLKISSDAKAVVITMGGIPANYDFIKGLPGWPNVHFVIPGGSQTTKIHENLVLLSPQSDFFHPDLINASDAVIGKVGYSTLAEVYHAGVPFGYITRPWFRESEALAGFIEREMNGIAIEETGFENGDWLSVLPDLLALPRIGRRGLNGAEQVARFVWKLLKGESGT